MRYLSSLTSIGSVRAMNGRQWLVVRVSSSDMVRVTFMPSFPSDTIDSVVCKYSLRAYYIAGSIPSMRMRSVSCEIGKESCCLNLGVRLAGMTSGSGAEAHVPDAAVGIII